MNLPFECRKLKHQTSYVSSKHFGKHMHCYEICSPVVRLARLEDPARVPNAEQAYIAVALGWERNFNL